MQREEVTSGLIKAIGFDPEKQELQVEFKNHKPDQPVKVYSYTPFTPERYAEFRAAESLGKFFLKTVKIDKSLIVTRIMEESDASKITTA
jgi:hypothetical protein